MSDTHDKVLFGVWVAITVLFLVSFIGGVVVHDCDIDDLLLAIWGALICSLYWRLWHEKAPATTVNVILDVGRNDD